MGGKARGRDVMSLFYVVGGGLVGCKVGARGWEWFRGEAGM